MQDIPSENNAKLVVRTKIVHYNSVQHELEGKERNPLCYQSDGYRNTVSTKNSST